MTVFINAIFLSIIFFLMFSSPVFAASITLSDGPGQLGSPEEEYAVNVSLSINVSDGTIYYLRGVFYKSGSTNYCGYTWNGNSWFSGPYSTSEGWRNFLQVTIQGASWSGNLRAKIDPTDSGCKDSGIYNFKVQRFTAAGSGSFDPQNEQVVEVMIPTPTPTPTPIPTSTPMPKPTSTPTPTSTSKPTSTPRSAPTPTPTKSPIIQLTSSPTGKILTTAASTVAAVLGVLGQESTGSGTVSAEPEPSGSPLVESQRQENISPKIVLSLGILAILAMVFTAFWIKKQKGI